MKRQIAHLILLFFLFSCGKQEFTPVKSPQTSIISAATTTTTGNICAGSTLVNPPVDILLLWDNTSSFNFVTAETKNALATLISSISSGFDYHILSAPLVTYAGAPTLFESVLIAKNSQGLDATAMAILKPMTQAINSLSFSTGPGSMEKGIERSLYMIESNRINGIFRNNAYTIVVIMSNEDDKGCEISTGFNSCAPIDVANYMAPIQERLLCLRGNAYSPNCAGVNSLNANMLRVMNVSPLTMCPNGLGRINTRYRNVSKYLYESPYSNGWPSPTDSKTPFSLAGVNFPDSFDLCQANFTNMFSGVNNAIQQSVINHVYNYWPIASATTSIDPNSIVVTRSDGKTLINHTGEKTIPVEGFTFAGTLMAQNTRLYPTVGEPYSGKMIQLYGVPGNDLLSSPLCFNISYQPEKATYGYIFLQNGLPYIPSIEVQINGAIVPQSATNGWEYLGLQYVSSLDNTLKILNIPASSQSGYFIKLNGSYKLPNNPVSPIQVSVLYNGAAVP